MKVNVNGKIEDIKLVYGVADNHADDWTKETVAVVSDNTDQDGNPIISQKHFDILKKIENELKKNNEFSFYVPTFFSLQELYAKMVNENKEKMAMQNNKLAKIVNAEMKKQAVSEKQLEDKAQEIADKLEKDHGYPKIDVDPNFAYGAYGFYFNFKDENGNSRQAKVDLGTKKECLEGLEKLYHNLVDRKNWWLKREANKKETKVKKQARAKYTQRQLKELVADGAAIDITTWSTSDVYKLQKEEQLEPIGSSYGVYGPNGRLYRGKSGKLYAVTARNNTLDQLPW